MTPELAEHRQRELSMSRSPDEQRLEAADLHENEWSADYNQLLGYNNNNSAGSPQRSLSPQWDSGAGWREESAAGGYDSWGESPGKQEAEAEAEQWLNRVVDEADQWLFEN